MHLQSDLTELPDAELVSSGHGSHVDSEIAPSTAEYVSTGHTTQSPDPLMSLYVPAAHG